MKSIVYRRGRIRAGLCKHLRAAVLLPEFPVILPPLVRYYQRAIPRGGVFLCHDCWCNYLVFYDAKHGAANAAWRARTQAPAS